MLSLPTSLLNHIARAAGDDVTTDCSARGSSAYASTCHALLESHQQSHPRSHALTLRYRAFGAPGPCVPVPSYPLRWSPLDVGMRDSVTIGDEKAAQISSPGQLLRILSHPESRFEELAARAGSVAMYVDYRTLLECRDVSLDGDCGALLEQLRKEAADIATAGTGKMSAIREAMLQDLEDDLKESVAAVEGSSGITSPAPVGDAVQTTAAVPASEAAGCSARTGAENPAGSGHLGRHESAADQGDVATPTDMATAPSNPAAAISTTDESGMASTVSAAAGRLAEAVYRTVNAAAAVSATAAAAPVPPADGGALRPSPPAVSQTSPPSSVPQWLRWLHEQPKGRDAIDAAGAAQLRRLLQLCGTRLRDGRGGLNVDFSSSHVGQWGAKAFSAWAGVLRSFPNISSIIHRDGKVKWLHTIITSVEQLFPVRAGLQYPLRLLDSDVSQFDGSTKWKPSLYCFEDSVKVRCRHDETSRTYHSTPASWRRVRLRAHSCAHTGPGLLWQRWFFEALRAVTPVLGR